MATTHQQGTAVYRICANSTNTWDVFQGSNALPLASFEDKSAALTYAMCLARGKVSWQSLLDSGIRSTPDNAVLGISRHS